jgi:hypothetical protein
MAGFQLSINGRFCLSTEGKVVALDDATKAIFGETFTKADRLRVTNAITTGVTTGRLVRAGPRAFRLPPAALARASEDDTLAAVTPRPAGRLAVRHQLARLAHLRNEFDSLFDEVLSECHRANGSAGASLSVEDERPSFPMRCAEPEEREP